VLTSSCGVLLSVRSLWIDGGVSEESENKFKQMSRCRHLRGYLLALYLFPSLLADAALPLSYVFHPQITTPLNWSCFSPAAGQPTECVPLPHWGPGKRKVRLLWSTSPRTRIAAAGVRVAVTYTSLWICLGISGLGLSKSSYYTLKLHIPIYKQTSLILLT
jgi:hypothetical protein